MDSIDLKKEKEAKEVSEEDRTLEILAKYDPEFRFRKVKGIARRIVFVMAVILSIFHVYTAGFGVLQELKHRAFHLTFVLPLVFLLYPIRRHKEKRIKYLIFDVMYSLFAGGMTSLIFGDLLKLLRELWILIFIVASLSILYFKIRELLPGKYILYLDMFVSVFYLGSIFYLIFRNYAFISSTLSGMETSLIILVSAVFIAIVIVLTFQFLNAFRVFLRKSVFVLDTDHVPFFDIIIAIMASSFSIYIFLDFFNLVLRAGRPLERDIFMGAFSILIILEAARRAIGPPLPIITMLVLANAYFGPYFLDIPGLDIFAHRGYPVSRIIDHMYLGTEGIYGIPVGVVATYVFHFVLFGIFISKTGLGKLFIDIGMAVAGGSPGGPAKVAIISSALFGSISGSSIANTVTTGSFTIPMMKSLGYSPRFAGAVEASASTGGQITPPVMGAAAFIMAEFLGIPYIKIAIAAIFPALIHYFAIYCQVHAEALKQGLRGLPREMLPKLNLLLKDRGLLIIPLAMIIYLLLSGRTPFMAAFWGIVLSVSFGQIHEKTFPLLIPILLSLPNIAIDINLLKISYLLSAIWIGIFLAAFIWIYKLKTSPVYSFILGTAPVAILFVLQIADIEPFLAAFWANMAIIAIGVFYRESKVGVYKIFDCLEWGTRNAIAIGAACACVGFIVGATTLTGLGLKFAQATIELATRTATLFDYINIGNIATMDGMTLFFTLFYTALACIFLGMGLPTTAQYIVVSMIATPALLKFNIHPLATHMFVFFYGILADVTPPVALAAYAAAGISGANPFKTGFTSFHLSMGKIYAPFAFVYSPIILLLPTLLDPTKKFDYVEFILVMATVSLGILSLGAGIVGYLADRTNIVERVLLIMAAGGLFIHEIKSSVVGFLLLICVYIIQKYRVKRNSAITDRGFADARGTEKEG